MAALASLDLKKFARLIGLLPDAFLLLGPWGFMVDRCERLAISAHTDGKAQAGTLPSLSCVLFSGRFISADQISCTISLLSRCCGISEMFASSGAAMNCV